MITIELQHDFDELTRRARIAKSHTSRRSRGLPKSGLTPNRMPYPQTTMKDIRIKSDLTIEEVWARLTAREDVVSKNGGKPYAPKHATSIYWTERHGSERKPVITAFSDVYGVSPEIVEAALLVPIKYKGCRTIKERWLLAEKNGWTIEYTIDGDKL